MNGDNKSKAVFMLPCSKCRALNRVNIDFSYELVEPEELEPKPEEKPKEEKKTETKTE